MSAVESQSSLFDEQGGAGPADRAADSAFLASLPSHLRTVRAREELTRDSLPRRGASVENPQLSEAAQRVWDAERQSALCLAEKYRALAELHAHEGEYEEFAEFDEVDTTRAVLALRVTANAAAGQLRDAHQAVHLFPRAFAALEAGKMPSAWFQSMIKSSRRLSDSSRKKVDVAVDSWSMDITAERFFRLVKKLIALLEQREQHPDPVSSLPRSVDLLPGHEPGTGILQIVGPIPDVLAQWKRLDESARAVQSAQRAALRDGTPVPHDPDGQVLTTGKALPLSVLRFVLMATATPDLEGASVPEARFRLNITVPVLTLLGASDAPGDLDGITPLPPSMARSLAGAAEVWHRVLTEPAHGAFLPLPAERCTPTAAMLEHLRLRNASCAVPGCTRPTSWASECDHIEECRRGTPGEGGPTEVENLHLLCWQHHLDKTNGLLDPTRLPTAPTEPGRTRWAVGPHGDSVTVIDDLDTESIRMAELLGTAWTAFLRGIPAGSADDEYLGEDITDTLPAAARAPAPGTPADRRPPARPPSDRSPSDQLPPGRRPRSLPPPDEVPSSDGPAPGAPGIPPGPWGEDGPPPF
ncbi:HNH endonuclease signature motif containing protein [Brachybacterium sp. AOP43-C2-M15]|uniref:HNH endonuclease signature motif containing protein n=1 Tax=Brachybacterium sp. AOP43-C2-M15 TaxID=3457661 RepID=UPI0040348A57